jgi:hypothetical protein
LAASSANRARRLGTLLPGFITGCSGWWVR